MRPRTNPAAIIRKFGRLATLAACLLLMAVPVTAQGPASGQMQIMVRVPRMASLSLASAEGTAQLLAVPGPTGSVLHLRVRRSAGQGQAVVYLLARSNAAYRMVVRLGGSAAGQAPLAVRPIEVAANAGGARLLPGAGAVRATAAQIGGLQPQAIVLEGPSISRGGNNSTPDNALLIKALIDLPDGVEEADLILAMEV
jgi:hypothetical protein